ncbi:hypothetical protein AMECASPLE_036798, partial [Ameca splendens]
NINQQISLSQPEKSQMLLNRFGHFYINNRGPAGGEKTISPGHLWVSHDRSALQIDMLLSNTGLLAAKKKKRGTDGWRPGWDRTN